METHDQTLHSLDLGDVAGNGLVDRRLFLTGSAAAGVAASGIASPGPASADALSVGSWMKVPGSPFVGYGQPSRFEDKVVRVAANPPNAPGTGAAAPIAPCGRLVNVSSAGHRFSDVDLEDPNFERGPYDPTVAYGRSKTANILFAVEFDRRHRARGNGIHA